MDIAYLAGLFDGEGWVRIDEHHVTNRPRPYHRFQLRMAIRMTHYPTILAIVKQHGGMLARDDSAAKKSSANRIQYQWSLWSNKARDLLVLLHPHLIVKAEQARIAIEFQNHMDSLRTHFRTHRGDPPDKEDIHIYRRQLMSMLSADKKKGYDIPKELLLPNDSGPTLPPNQAARAKVPLSA